MQGLLYISNRNRVHTVMLVLFRMSDCIRSAAGQQTFSSRVDNLSASRDVLSSGLGFHNH